MYRLLLSYVFLDPCHYLLRLYLLRLYLLRLLRIVVRRRQIGFEITGEVLDDMKHSRGSHGN